MSRAAAQVQYNAQLRETMKLRAEEEVNKMAIQTRHSFCDGVTSRLSDMSGDEAEAVPAAVLRKQALDSVAVIETVGKTSGNLKGGHQRKLKLACNAIRDAFGVLEKRSTSEEIQHLEASNAQLHAELAEMKKKLNRLEAAMKAAPKAPSQVEVQPTPLPRVEHAELPSDRATIVAMMNARFDALEVEGRLLPAKNLRPQLAADKKRTAGGEKQPVESTAKPAPSAAEKEKEERLQACPKCGSTSN
jgi:hypothetical protein